MLTLRPDPLPCASYSTLVYSLLSIHLWYNSRRHEVIRQRGGGDLPATDGVAVMAGDVLLRHLLEEPLFPTISPRARTAPSRRRELGGWGRSVAGRKRKRGGWRAHLLLLVMLTAD